MTLAALGWAASGVAVLAVAIWSALAIRMRRVQRQPTFPEFRPSPPARRTADLRAHPQDADTQEIPLHKENRS